MLPMPLVSAISFPLAASTCRSTDLASMYGAMELVTNMSAQARPVVRRSRFRGFHRAGIRNQQLQRAVEALAEVDNGFKIGELERFNANLERLQLRTGLAGRRNHFPAVFRILTREFEADSAVRAGNQDFGH